MLQWCQVNANNDCYDLFSDEPDQRPVTGDEGPGADPIHAGEPLPSIGNLIEV